MSVFKLGSLELPSHICLPGNGLDVPHPSPLHSPFPAGTCASVAGCERTQVLPFFAGLGSFCAHPETTPQLSATTPSRTLQPRFALSPLLSHRPSSGVSSFFARELPQLGLCSLRRVRYPILPGSCHISPVLTARPFTLGDPPCTHLLRSLKLPRTACSLVLNYFP